VREPASKVTVHSPNVLRCVVSCSGTRGMHLTQPHHIEPLQSLLVYASEHPPVKCPVTSDLDPCVGYKQRSKHVIREAAVYIDMVVLLQHLAEHQQHVLIILLLAHHKGLAGLSPLTSYPAFREPVWGDSRAIWVQCSSQDHGCLRYQGKHKQPTACGLLRHFVHTQR